MTLLALELPEESAELPLWIERQLVGLNLRQLVTELTAIGQMATDDATARQSSPPATTTPADAAQWLGDSKGTVLADGLRGLPAEKLSELLRQPRLLGSLQELVLVEGGPYWEEVARRAPAVEARVAMGRERVVQAVRGETSPIAGRIFAPPASSGPGPKAVDVAPPPAPFAKRYGALAICLALAACLLLMVTQFQGPGAQLAWGWSRPGAIDERASAPKYLEGLAATGHEWFDERPTSPADVRRRIQEMRDGCDRVINSPHAPLAMADQQWLVERCLKWREKFDAQLAALDAGGDPLAARGQIDETVNKLIGTLQDRAKQIATG